jgi:O-antigen biosynthesis protein
VSGRLALVLDDRPPRPQRDGGSARMMALLQTLPELGWRVIFGYTGEERGWGADPPSEARLAGDQAIDAFLREQGERIDAAILSRPTVAADWSARVRRDAPGALLVYDTVDISHLREFRRAKLTGSSGLLKLALLSRRQELATAGEADCTLVVSEPERRLLLSELPDARVYVVSNIHPPNPLPRPFGERHGFVFVGHFEHEPNVDGVKFLLDEVWPLVREADPEAELLVVGHAAPVRLLERADPGVRFAGQVADLEPLLAGAKAMVAPLRFGAGVKGKVLQAMAHGLPVAGTTVAFEGIGDGSAGLVADAAGELAGAMLRLTTDEELWRDLRERGLALVERDYSAATARAALAQALAPALERAGA